MSRARNRNRNRNRISSFHRFQGDAPGVMSDYYENTWEVLVLVLVLVIVIVIESTVAIADPPTAFIFILCEEAPLHDDS